MAHAATSRFALMSPPDKRPIVLALQDPLKHFSRNGALVKLIALFIWRMPLILAAITGPVLWFGRVAAWW
jgi:hypothetical protein